MIQRYQKGSRMSQAVSYGGLVYIAGQVAENRKADIKDQTRDVLGRSRLYCRPGRGKSQG